MIHPTELLQKVNLLLVMSNEFKSFTLMFNWNYLEQAVVAHKYKEYVTVTTSVVL